jgi:hypothetical protein
MQTPVTLFAELTAKRGVREAIAGRWMSVVSAYMITQVKPPGLGIWKVYESRQPIKLYQSHYDK